MANNHSRPWEKLPEAVLNLLELNSMYAYWDQSSNGIAGWRLRRASNTDHRVGTGYFVREGALLDEWLTAVEQVEARWP